MNPQPTSPTPPIATAAHRPGYKTSEFWYLIGWLLAAVCNRVFGFDIESNVLIAGILSGLGFTGYRSGVKKRAAQIACIALAGLLCVGCSLGVPANKICLPGGYEVRASKNVTIEDFKATFTTNGALSGIEFKRWSSTNDSDVISKSAAGQVAIINASGNVAAKVTDAAITAAAKK